MSTLRERFWSKVDRRAPGACWPWMGARVPNGYGSIGYVVVDGRLVSQVGAHRVVYYLTHGAWPRIARHACDNRICVNPAHISDGSTRDNVRDSIERGGNYKLSKAECAQGHPYPEQPLRNGKGHRLCATCVAEWRVHDNQRKRELRAARKAA